MLKRTATGRVLIFTRTKHRARNLSRDPAEGRPSRGGPAGQHDAEPAPEPRSTASEAADSTSWSPPTSPLAASTSPSISHVINFDMPNTVDAYTHRIGRTGRADKTGEAFTLASPGDGLMVRDIERALGKRVDPARLPGLRLRQLQLPKPSSNRNTARRRAFRGLSADTRPRGKRCSDEGPLRQPPSPVAGRQRGLDRRVQDHTRVGQSPVPEWC